jgi:hypothetical protein
MNANYARIKIIKENTLTVNQIIEKKVTYKQPPPSHVKTVNLPAALRGLPKRSVVSVGPFTTALCPRPLSSFALPLNG